MGVSRGQSSAIPAECREDTGVLTKTAKQVFGVVSIGRGLMELRELFFVHKHCDLVYGLPLPR